MSLFKIANDLRWMGSGPRTGLAEIRLPDLQPGSSIMPGKVNPVIAEVVTQVGAQVIGNDAAIAFAGSQGNFELNVFVPVMAPQPARVDPLAHRARVAVFADKCIAGIEAERRALKEYAESSPSIGTALNPYIGYEVAAEIVKESTQDRASRSARSCKRRKLMTDDELDRALDVARDDARRHRRSVRRHVVPRGFADERSSRRSSPTSGSRSASSSCS